MRFLAGLPGVCALLSGCGGDTAGPCIELRQPLDPLSDRHVLEPSAVSHLTDPPTSGPQLSGPAATGLLARPIPAAAQVRVLEAGGVVVQYADPITAPDVRTLLDASEVTIVIAPADSLPAPVVATAWTWKLTCRTVDLDAIAKFAVSHPTTHPVRTEHYCAVTTISSRSRVLSRFAGCFLG